MDFDPTQWPVVGGTNAGSYREITTDILVAVPNPGYVQTAAGARASLAEINRIAQERNRALALVVLLDRVRSQDAQSRRVWQREMTRLYICALALVGATLLSRAIGSFFIGLHKPTVPTRFLTNIDDAVVWSRSQLERHQALQ